jgi:hypothetical protein
MTDTTHAAVARFNQFDVYSEYARMYEKPDGRWVRYSDYAALSAQLAAANQRAEILADSVAKAREVAGKNAELRKRCNAIANLCRELIDAHDWVGTGSSACGDIERAEVDRRLDNMLKEPNT